MSQLKVNAITNLSGGTPNIPGLDGGGSGGSGADAWGKVASDGSLTAGMNIASTAPNGTGIYNVTFTTPMPSADYAVTLSMDETSGAGTALKSSQHTVNGFRVVCYSNPASAAVVNSDFAFAVFSTNALPPTGGTGTDAWVNFDGTSVGVGGDCTILSSFNVDRVEKTAGGRYKLHFVSDLPAEYAVQIATNASGDTFVSTRSTDSCLIGNNNSSGVPTDVTDVNVAINATNATLPDSFTEEQIQSVVDLAQSGATNTGASAWGFVDDNASLKAGQNIASITRTSTGRCDIVFQTPMPNANYSVVGTSNIVGGGNESHNFTTHFKTVNGFEATTQSGFDYAMSNDPFSFVVHATNALPPKGGTGTDAWASVQLDGTVGASFNGTVVRTAVGLYEATFTTPMPTSNYSVVGSSNGNNGLVLYISSKTASGFTYGMSTGAANLDSDHSWTVNATNATLPDSFSEEQIQSVVDLAQSGVTNPGASAWGKLASNGNLLSGLNVASSSKVSTGKYSVTFSTPMPDANYSIQVSTTGLSDERTAAYTNATSTGFEIYRYNTAGAAIDGEVSFTVHATNALPPKGGTGTDAWGSVQGNGTLDASFNVASVTRTSLGRYDVVFTTPMPSSKYSVTGGEWRHLTVSSKTANGFSVALADDSGGNNVDRQFSFAVNATNATLPDSFSEEQIQSVVDLAQSGATNPGASAWGNISSSGELDNGLNIASVTRTGTGLYDVVFQTPMPNDEYSVVVGGSSNMPRALSQTATGFTVETRNANATVIDSGSSFQVFATNALPPRGGTGADAWGSWSTDTGDIRASFNIASITPTATGQYDVLFNTPMPVGRYSVTTGSQDRSVLVSLTDKSSTGFKINTTQIASTTRVDASFDFQVNATNAVLPNSFTEAEIQSVVDLAQSGATTRMPGEVTMWSGSSAPSGWLECNGQSTSGFANLAAIVGSNVPDLRGEFVRGWDNGRGVDSGRALLSTQDEAFKSHDHPYVRGQGAAGNNVTGGPTPIGDGVTNQTTSAVGGTETRPRNISLMYIIKT